VIVNEGIELDKVVEKFFVMIRSNYPHNENLRGQIGVMKKRYPDGTILVAFEEGAYAGDKVCMDPKWVEPLS
jgi:hypothetical protein